MSKRLWFVAGLAAASVLWFAGVKLFVPKPRRPDPVVVPVVTPGPTKYDTTYRESKELSAERDKWRREANGFRTMYDKLLYDYVVLKGAVGQLSDTQDIAYAESSWSMKRVVFDRNRQLLEYAAFKAPDSWMTKRIRAGRLWKLDATPVTVVFIPSRRNFDVGLVLSLASLSDVEAKDPRVTGKAQVGLRFPNLELLVGWSQPLYGPAQSAGLCAEVRWQVWR